MAPESLPKTISNRRSFSGTVPVRSERARFWFEVHHWYFFGYWKTARKIGDQVRIPKSVIGKFTGQFPSENQQPEILRANQIEDISQIFSGKYNFSENIHELSVSSIWMSPDLWPPDFYFVTEYLLFEWHGAKMPKTRIFYLINSFNIFYLCVGEYT